MESKLGGIALGMAVVVAAVVLFVVLRDGADSGSEEASVPTIVVRDGKPVAGVRELDFEAGEEVRFAVRSDVADELHVHGYDVERELPANRTVRVEFPAELEGIFEAELHESEEQIAELRIGP